jgi:hypothetical protein
MTGERVLEYGNIACLYKVIHTHYQSNLLLSCNLQFAFFVVYIEISLYNSIHQEAQVFSGIYSFPHHFHKLFIVDIPVL